jgi:hypothetical protein
MSEPDPNGWVKFSERWPTETDCDVFGMLEIAGMGSRSFTTLAHCQDFRYNLTRATWWRTPTPLPYITG